MTKTSTCTAPPPRRDSTPEEAGTETDLGAVRRAPKARRLLQVLEGSVRALRAELHPLVWTAPLNLLEERHRLRTELQQGRFLQPHYRYAQTPSATSWPLLLQRAVLAARDLGLEALYAPLLARIEVAAMLCARLHAGQSLHADAAVLYGDGQERVSVASWAHPGTAAVCADAGPAGESPAPSVVQVAHAWMHATAALPEAPRSAGPADVMHMARVLADSCKLPLSIAQHPSLSACAAFGNGVLYVRPIFQVTAARARGIAVHEVLGHALAHANACAHPLDLLRQGTAYAAETQEGLALHLEACTGTLGPERMRVLAARTLVCAALRQGADFAEQLRRCIRDHGLPPEEALSLCERAYRGGGLGRELIYLRGLLRVQHALKTGVCQLDTLAQGRVSLEALPMLEALGSVGLRWRLSRWLPRVHARVGRREYFGAFSRN